MAEDRRVHARYETKEIVRYERAGKWYLESNASALIPARPITVKEAARLAADGVRQCSGQITFGRAGGRTFDRLVRVLLAESDGRTDA